MQATPSVIMEDDMHAQGRFPQEVIAMKNDEVLMYYYYKIVSPATWKLK